MKGRLAFAAVVAAVAGCDMGGDAALPAPNLAHFDVQAGEAVLLKTSSATDGLGQPLPSDLTQGQLTGMAADGSLRALHLTDSSGAQRSFAKVLYDDVDSALGLFYFDGELYAFRKADGALIRLGHRLAVNAIARYATASSASPRVYLLAAGALVYYEKAAIAAAAAGSTLTPAVQFTIQGFDAPTEGIVDEARGAVYMTGTGVFSLAGASLRAAIEYYFAGEDTIYTQLQASYVQCPGGSPATGTTTAAIAVTSVSTTTTPLFVTRPSSDVLCDPETGPAFGIPSRNRKVFYWAWPGVPRAGSASYAYEIVGADVIEHPNLSQSLAADFTELSGVIFFDCTSEQCLWVASHPTDRLAAFGLDDAQDLYASDTSPPLKVRSMQAMPTTGDFFLQGIDPWKVVRATLTPGALSYVTVTINGDYLFAAVD